MEWVIVVVAVLVGAALSWVWFARLRRAAAPAPGTVGERPDRLPAPLAEFHVRGPEALVYFEVPLPEGESDDVLREVLLREALEVVREKRHNLPITEVHRVVAFGRRNGEWQRVGAVDLDVPGELPPPLPPPLRRQVPPGFDPLDLPGDLPEAPPGLAAARSDERLTPWQDETRNPAAIDAGLRAQGIDPGTAGPGEVVLGIMRLSGYAVTPGPREQTHFAVRAGRRAFVRTVPHHEGEHPELDEDQVRRFCVEVVESGAERGLLVTDKYSPFEIYERERRDPRLRFVTRERLQHFIDALSLG